MFTATITADRYDLGQISCLLEDLGYIDASQGEAIDGPNPPYVLFVTIEGGEEEKEALQQVLTKHLGSAGYPYTGYSISWREGDEGL